MDVSLEEGDLGGDSAVSFSRAELNIYHGVNGPTRSGPSRCRNRTNSPGGAAPELFEDKKAQLIR